MKQTSDRIRPDELAVWKLYGDDVRSNQTVPLTALNEDNLAVACGVDGRVSGVIRRDLGNLLYANLQTVAPIREDGTVIPDYGQVSFSDWVADQLDSGQTFECIGIYPFRIEETNGTKFVYGLVVHTRVQEPSLDGSAGPTHTTPWRYRLHIFYTSESRSVDRPVLDYTIVLLPPEAPGEPSWWRRASLPYDDSTDDLDYDFPVSVFSQGRYLYIGPSHTLSSAGDLAEVQPPVTLWFDVTDYNDPDDAVRGPMNGWRSDWFAFISTYPNGNRAFNKDVTPPQPILAHAIGVPNAIASGPEGRYLFSYRYVDFNRGRVSNFANHLEIDQPYVQRAGDGSPVSKTWGVFMTDGWRSYLTDLVLAPEYRNWIAKLAGPGPLNPGAAYYQVISTLSSGDLAVAGGGKFYVHDTMTTTVTEDANTGWDYHAVTAPYADVIGLKVLALESGAVDGSGNPIGRQDNEFPSNSSEVDVMTVGDLGLITTPPLSGLYDTMQTPISWLDATFYQNLSFIASPDGGYVRIHWSDPRGIFPETFPLGCSELTTCRVNIRPEGTWTLSPLDIKFVQASDFLYLFADGQIIQIRRNGTAVELVPMYRGYQLLNKQCACTNGTSIFFVTRKGFFMLDGNSGSLGKLEGLGRIIRDRWSSPVVQSGLSVAYDENMGAVFVQSARTSETAIIHLDTHRIIFRVGSNFKFCVEADFPTDDGGTARQVYFGSEYGLRVVRPRLYYDPYNPDAPPYSMNGIPTNAMIRTVLSVSSSGEPQGTTFEQGGTTTLTLDTPLNKIADLSEVTVSFLSGPLKGQIFNSIPTVHRYTDGLPMDETTNTVSIGVDLNWTDIGDTPVYIAISTIPTILIAGPLSFTTDQSDQASDSFKRRQVTTAIATFGHLSQQSPQTVEIAPFQIGVGRPEAVHGWEPLGGDSTYYGPSYGPITTWFVPVNDSLDYTPDVYLDPTTDGRAPVLVDFPANLEDPSVTDASKNVAYIRASMRQPCPIFFSLIPDLNFDLRELRFKGIIGTTDVDRKA